MTSPVGIGQRDTYTTLPAMENSGPKLYFEILLGVIL